MFLGRSGAECRCCMASPRGQWSQKAIKRLFDGRALSAAEGRPPRCFGINDPKEEYEYT